MFGSEHNVRVQSDSEPEPLFRFGFNGLTEPNLEHCVRVRVRTLFRMFGTGPRPVYERVGGAFLEQVQSFSEAF